MSKVIANFFQTPKKDTEMLQGKLDDVKNGLQAATLAADPGIRTALSRSDMALVCRRN